MTDKFELNGDPQDDPQYPEHIRYEVLKETARDHAKKSLARQSWTPPPYPTSLAEQLAEKGPEIPWVYDGLLIEGGKAMAAAQWKAGKTTLLMDATRSLVIGGMFLGRFEVNVDNDERVGYLNLELPKDVFNHDIDKMLLPSEARKRIEIYHAMEYKERLDFKNDLAVEWLISWLTNNGIEHFFIDPLSSIFVASDWGRDFNEAFGKWWMVLEDIHREAKLRSTFIAHHAGVAEEAAGRGRGGAALNDKPDVNMSYRYNVESDGSHTDKPKDNKRFLIAYGRGGVNVNDYEVIFDPNTNILNGTHSGQSRKDSQAEFEAIKMWRVVYDYRQTTGGLINKSGIFNALGWQLKGKSADRFGAYYSYCIRMGWVVTGVRSIDGIPHAAGITPPGQTP